MLDSSATKPGPSGPDPSASTTTTTAAVAVPAAAAAPNDLSRSFPGYDILVSELLDSSLLGEGVIPAVVDAWQRLLSESQQCEGLANSSSSEAIVVPYAATMYAQVDCALLRYFVADTNLHNCFSGILYLHAPLPPTPPLRSVPYQTGRWFKVSHCVCIMISTRPTLVSRPLPLAVVAAAAATVVAAAAARRCQTRATAASTSDALAVSAKARGVLTVQMTAAPRAWEGVSAAAAGGVWSFR